jgi:hypothetical protein
LIDGKLHSGYWVQCENVLEVCLLSAVNFCTYSWIHFWNAPEEACLFEKVLETIFALVVCFIIPTKNFIFHLIWLQYVLTFKKQSSVVKNMALDYIEQQPQNVICVHICGKILFLQICGNSFHKEKRLTLLVHHKWWIVCVVLLHKIKLNCLHGFK